MYCFIGCKSFDLTCPSCRDMYIVKKGGIIYSEILNDDGTLEMRPILLTEKERIEYLWSFSEYNYYKKYGKIRSEIMKLRLINYDRSVKSSSMEGSRCAAAFMGPDLESIFSGV